MFTLNRKTTPSHRANIYPTHPLSLRSLTHPATYTPFQLRMPWYGTFSPNATAGGTSHCVDHYSAGEEKTRGANLKKQPFNTLPRANRRETRRLRLLSHKRASKPYLLIGQGERRASHTTPRAQRHKRVGTRPRQQSIYRYATRKKEEKKKGCTLACIVTASAAPLPWLLAFNTRAERTFRLVLEANVLIVSTAFAAPTSATISPRFTFAR